MVYNKLPWKIFLTTERSEVVPFFRAVRAKKRGREATPKGGEAPPSMVAKRPLTGGEAPPIFGREATPRLLGGSPPFVSFLKENCPNR